MDQEKIGKFIAECRKEKGLTQVQLAEKLGTTDKSISKWENGVCLPDSSQYESLCNILNITINELFAGKKIKDEDYKNVADENLMQILKSFSTKEEAVNFMMNETHLSYEECSNAYDFYINLYKID